ncbi:RNA-guided endonuclease InsQ/TnpB family protein [Thiothrix fructosivorans]|uniref:Transposase n=1 Tax=Thiothrix fructosivorans TaxID=111770 RepID=A0A8B0SFK8_9GAMM|nr:RNA-guided endonuclease TnpB family protein [Thiothrix fructosivorans]MBO0613724.1 transposase [Thiothrix fructosivorans]QTX10863.1 transposase [Thiothrix fructosivorans]
MSIPQTAIKTLSVRVRDKHAAVLSRMAFEANQVWNAANAETAEWCSIAVPEVGWIRTNLSAFDLQKQLKSIKQERSFIIHSATVQEVIAVHAKSRRQFKKDKLRWRISSGTKRSLGWIPFKSGTAQWKNGQVRFAGYHFKVWDSYGLSQYAFRAGSFSEDARGRWYFNVVVEVAIEKVSGTEHIGIDLGLKETATSSNGDKLECGNFYRKLEAKLGTAQRAKQKKRVKAIHAKIKNRRKDALHKFTTKLVRENEFIVVGDVSSSALAKTKLAKSVLDAGWFMLKTQLKYKALARSVVFLEVNEAYSTQACSHCGSISDSSPKGRAGLGIREWRCPDCRTLHDRDVNAARNHLAAGYSRLAGGISVL